MSEEIQRSTGRPSNFKQDRGGVAAEFGPFVGIVKNNVDPTRAGRLQVYIETFAGGDEMTPPNGPQCDTCRGFLAILLQATLQKTT